MGEQLVDRSTSSWTSWFPSRLSQCPRSSLTVFLRDAWYVIRRLAEQLVAVPTPSPALAPAPRTGAPAGGQCRRSCLSLSRSSRVTMGTCQRQLSGPTGAYWWRVGSSHTQWAPPHRGTPPGQGGIQILAAVTLADVAVVDAPVIMQLKFQQSFVVSRHVPQHSRSIDRVVDIPVASQQTGHALICRRPLRFHSCSSWTSLSCPSVQRPVWYRQCSKLWNCRRCSSCGVWTSL